LIELLVVIAIIALLVSILMPSLQRAKRLASVAACAVNMRSSLMGGNIYAADYNDWPWNYADGAHNHVNPNDASYNPALAPYPPADAPQQTDGQWYGGDTEWHLYYEGRSQRSHWRGKLIAGRYGSARSLGCAAPPPKGWDLIAQGNDVETNTADDVLKTPPFVYRGRATGTDYDLDVYAGGNIAFGWAGTERNRMNHRPRPNSTRSMIVLNCPVYAKSMQVPGVSWTETVYMQPHQPNLAAYHIRWELGEGTLGHILAENVGFTAGHVLFADSGGMTKKYVDPDTGKISAAASERGQLPYGW